MYEAHRRSAEDARREREFWLFVLFGASAAVVIAAWIFGPWPWYAVGVAAGVPLWWVVRTALDSPWQRTAFYTALCALLHLASYRPPNVVFIHRVSDIPVGTTIRAVRERFPDMPVFQGNLPPDDYTGVLLYGTGHPSQTPCELMEVLFVDGKVVRTQLVRRR